MSHSFLAFIDESGDDGLAKFRQAGAEGGSSHWLVLSALVMRQSNSLAAVRWRNEIRSRLEQKPKDLHFVGWNHSQRVEAARCLSQLPVRLVSVMVYKKHVSAETFSGKNQLYFFMARFLVEQLSWLCRDFRRQVPEGNGQLAITFSQRGGMSYPDCRDYLERLKNEETKIHWPVIDVAAVDALAHSRSASLQLADVATSSFAAAMEPDRYGNCELRYALSLKPVTYSRAEQYLGYGVKIFPHEETCALTPQQISFLDVFKK